MLPNTHKRHTPPLLTIHLLKDNQRERTAGGISDACRRYSNNPHTYIYGYVCFCTAFSVKIDTYSLGCKNISLCYAKEENRVPNNSQNLRWWHFCWELDTQCFGQDLRCWLLGVVYHVSTLSVFRPLCKCKCMRGVFSPKLWKCLHTMTIK